MTRKCRVTIDEKGHDMVFHGFGTEIVWGDDNMPHEKTIAIVETASGQVMTVDPYTVRFTDKPPTAKRPTQPRIRPRG